MAGILNLDPWGVSGVGAAPYYGLGMLSSGGAPAATGVLSAPPAQGGFLGGLIEAFQKNPQLFMGLAQGLLSGPTTREALAKGFSGGLQGMQVDKQRGALNEYMESPEAGGLTPAMKKLFAGNPQLAAEYIKSKFAAPGKLTDDIQNFQYYRNEEMAAGRVPKPFHLWKETAKEDKPPATELFYDPKTGQPYKGQWNPATKTWDRVGGVKAPEGMSIRTNPDGTFEFVQGSGVTGDNQALDRAPRGAIQKDIDDLQKQKAQIEHIGDLYDPSFLTYAGKVYGAVSRIQDKAGDLPIVGNVVAPSEEQKAFLAKQTAFKQNVEQVFNAYRKDITGAAAALKELDRLKQSVINTDQSPTEFKSAMAEYAGALQRGLDIKLALLKEGIPLGSSQFSAEFEKRFLDPGNAGARTLGTGPASRSYNWSPDGGLKPAQ